ncbi:MAG: protein kinase [Planctomycetia bacterium]|nr:protein kinase [Planctomycetia bacterium]
MPVRIANQAEPIPGYKLIERLGRGGFGEVWKAEAPGGLLKAIKFVYGDLEDATNKDKASGGSQELRALNRVKTVRHPFILSLERVDIVEGQLVIVMELADKSLQDRYRECQELGLPGIPREELLRYVEEAAEALDLMNTEYQLQHLDIKPQNLFLVRNHVKVADFGLVKDLEGMKASITGGVTPLYAAPETFEGWVSRYSDQYSLAIVYQELLTGQRPFDGSNARQLLRQHVEQEPDVSSLPSADQVVIARALAKKPNDRYPSCGYMVRLLRSGGSEAAELGGASPPAAAPAQVQWATPKQAPTPDSGPPSAWDRPAEEQTRNLGPRADESPRGSATARPSVADTGPPAQGRESPPSATNRVAVQPAAPVEFKGPGMLFPALVVGLGQMGLAVLLRLREAICERFGDIETLPNIRLLGIDTDPDAVTAATRAGKGAALVGRELLLTRLNRPAHFVKPRDGAVGYQTWLDPHLLYRIPRNQQTAGLRFLGRLAFTDNYREIADRLRGELGACSEADAVATADRQSKLGMRSNRPRVYVVNSLAGGTGGGMFIDVAYLSRFFLKQLGYAQPDLVGLFFVPPAEYRANRPTALGNTYAALAELHHFSAPDVTYTARYLAKEAPLTDADPPFGRCLLLPQDPEEAKNREWTGLAAGFLLRDMLSPLGRAADTRRATLLPAAAAPAPVLTSFGMHRLTWPRRPLVQQIARRICLRLAQRWTAKDPSNIQDTVANWARDQWAKRQLEADRLIACLKAASEGVLDAVPEEIFTEMAQEFAKQVPSGANPDPALVQRTLEGLERLVGRPDSEKPMPKAPLLAEGLENAARTLLGTCEQKLAEMAVHLVEQPKFRLAGAEEAIRQFNTILQTAIQQQEPLCEEFLGKSNGAHARITGLLEVLKLPTAKRKGPSTSTAELTELFRIYPTLRLRGLIMLRTLTILRSLRGNCPEYLREFTFCRTRLLDLVKAFETPLPLPKALDLGSGRDLFPPGCQTLDEAVNQFMTKLTEEELHDIDTRVQALLKRQFTALVHVCTTAANLLRDLETAMQQELETFVAGRLGSSNAVETFLGQYPQDKTARQEIAAAHQEAAPSLTVEPNAPSNELTVVVVPTDAASDKFCEQARQALPQAELTRGPKGDDILFFRERLGLRVTDLPQTGAAAHEAYVQMTKMEHMSPHTRSDVTDWRLPPPH